MEDGHHVFSPNERAAYEGLPTPMPDDALRLSSSDEERLKAYRQELDYLRQGGDSGLISKGRCNLSKNMVLEQISVRESPANAAVGRSWDDTVAEFLHSPALASDPAPIADIMDRQNLIRRHFAGRTHFTIQYCLSRDGEIPVWFSTVANTCVSPETGDVECFTYTYDITDKTLEEQVFSRLPMLGFDVVGLLYVKTHACRYFRIKMMRPGSLYEHLEDYYASIGEDIAKIVLPDQRDYVREGLKIETITAKLETDETHPFTYSMINREGKILQKLLQFSWLDEGHTTVFFCKSDITKQTESEHRQIDELAAAKLAADKANEAKSMFLSSMSHDLRTPLNGIIGFTNLALNTQDAAKRQDYLEKIKTSGELLLALVNDTLELSRIESGKYVLEPAAVRTQELWKTVVTAIRPLAEAKNIRFITELDDFPGQVVWADKLKLQKVFLNLLSNAVKYTPAGGFVKASARALESGSSGCNYCFSVEDSGIGMKADFLPRIFEPFSQEHRPEAANVAGTGLGLSIVKRTVDLMGGAINVQSRPGKGSVFTVELPLRVLDPAEIPPDEGNDVPQFLVGKRVLLLEDNYLNTEIAALLLHEKGIEVDCACDGREGLEKFSSSFPGRYDAILTDIRMPLMDGYSFARAIRALDRDDARSIPIIAMTADAFEDDVKKCMDAGMDGHIAKPINPDELFGALMRSGVRRSPVSNS